MANETSKEPALVWPDKIVWVEVRRYIVPEEWIAAAMEAEVLPDHRVEVPGG